MPTLCTSIYMKSTTPAFAILRGMVNHIDAASVKSRYGYIRPCWKTRIDVWGRGSARLQRLGVPHDTIGVSNFGRWRNHRRRHAEILTLSSDLRLRMLLRRRESTRRQRWRAVDRSSCSIECDGGFQPRAPDSAQLCQRRRLGQIGRAPRWVVSVPLATMHWICW